MLVNIKYRSPNYRPRNEANVQFLVIHYTEVPLHTTLGIFTNDPQLAALDIEGKNFKNNAPDLQMLCKQGVSAHYVCAEDGEIFNLVDEEFTAYHAGNSYWNGTRNLNDYSIGIELVNLGDGSNWPEAIPANRAIQVKGGDKKWCSFTQAQITQTIELCQEIIRRHNIKPSNIIGHSDIAWDRKPDPGPLFPWKIFAEAGIGIWHDNLSSSILKQMPANPVFFAQTKLAQFGYDCSVNGIADPQFKKLMQSFQMHFRPENIDGEIDLECLQIMDNLCNRKVL